MGVGGEAGSNALPGDIGASDATDMHNLYSGDIGGLLTDGGALVVSLIDASSEGSLVLVTFTVDDTTLEVTSAGDGSALDSALRSI